MPTAPPPGHKKPPLFVTYWCLLMFFGPFCLFVLEPRPFMATPRELGPSPRFPPPPPHFLFPCTSSAPKWLSPYALAYRRAPPSLTPKPLRFLFQMSSRFLLQKVFFPLCTRTDSLFVLGIFGSFPSGSGRFAWERVRFCFFLFASDRLWTFHSFLLLLFLFSASFPHPDTN